MKRDEMWHKACERFEEWACKYADKNVTDKEFFEKLCCSIYSGDEFEESDSIVLDERLHFIYKGYVFECMPCTAFADRQSLRTIFTDRYVYWMYGHKDDDGHTLKEYLKLNPNETEQDNCWASKIYLVPNAWAYGADFDCLPGSKVQGFILKYIDEFLEKNPDL